MDKHLHTKHIMIEKSEAKSIILVENSLYHYVSTQNIPERNKSKGMREAIYINLPKIENKKLCVADWQLTEQHLTIDRFINHSLPFLSSSHFTQTYSCISQPNQNAIVHIHFDRQGNIHESIFIRVKNLETKCYINEEHTFTINPEFVMEQAKLCQQKVFEFIEKQRSYFKDLSKQCNTIDYQLSLSNQQFFEAEPNQKHPILVDSIQLSQEYFQLLEKMVLHSNSNFEYSVYVSKKSYIYNLINQLNKVLGSVKPVKKSKQKIAQPIEELTLELSSEEVKTDTAITIESPLITQQRILSEQIDLLLTTSTTENIVQYLTLINAINENLLELELIYSKKIIQTFIKEQRARLPAIDLHNFFLNLCKTGNIAEISQAYQYVLCKIDMLSLFAQMHELILKQDSFTEKLIQAADFFYDNSTEYQAYILIEQIKFKEIKERHCVSPLICAFIANNLHAFKMHLRQGRSIHLAHTYIGEIAFNALQSIIICSSSFVNETSLTHYINLLFEAKAKFETPQLPSQEASLSKKIESPEELSQFVSFMKTHGKFGQDDKISSIDIKKTSMKKIKATPGKSNSPNVSSQDYASLQKFQNKKNILEALIFIGLFNNYSVAIFESILAYTDLKTCLIAITNTLNNQSIFMRLISTYNKAKITFFKESDELSTYITQCQDSINYDYKTLQFTYAAISKANQSPPINKEDLKLKIDCLINRFNELYQPLSNHEKRSLMQALKTDFIKAGIDGTPESDKLSILDALTISIASLPDITKEEVKLMIALTIKYCQIIIKLYLNDQIEYRTRILNELFIKITNLMISMKIDSKEASADIKAFHWLVDNINPELKILLQKVRPHDEHEQNEEKEGKAMNYFSLS